MPGDRWCVTAANWLRAYEDGAAAFVVLASHERALDIVPLAALEEHAVTSPRVRRPELPTFPRMRPTLFEFAGGEPAFLALATAHHARCPADPELNHPFSHPGQHPKHVERLAAYWAEVMGGPPTFSESYGDQPRVLRMHAGNGDMGDLGERFLTCFDLRRRRRRAAGPSRLPRRPALPTCAGRWTTCCPTRPRRHGPSPRRGDASLGMGRPRDRYRTVNVTCVTPLGEAAASIS